MHVYEIARNEMPDFLLGESSLYDDLNLLAVDYVKDEDDPEEVAQCFLQVLERAGATLITAKDDEGRTVKGFILTNEAKVNNPRPMQ